MLSWACGRAGFILKVDHCFKPCKKVRIQIGDQAYEATALVLNEYMETAGWYAVESTSIDDLAAPLHAMSVRILNLHKLGGVVDSEGYQVRYLMLILKLLWL
jgi:hypothetical protein